MTTQLTNLEAQLADKHLIENALATAEKGRTEATQRLEKTLKENASIMKQVQNPVANQTLLRTFRLFHQSNISLI